jgi:hypothetical protein
MNWIAANLFLLLVILGGLTPAWAQAPASPSAPSAQGVTTEKPATSPSQVDPGQLNILPSAGVSKPSAAPTMVFECGKRPEECTKPATEADKQTTPEKSEKPAG